MTKRRFVGIIMMVVAIGIGTYVGGWVLFIKSIIQMFFSHSYKAIIINLIKMGIFFPMLMSVMLPLFELGRMFFLEKND